MGEKCNYWFALIISLFIAGCSSNSNNTTPIAPAYLPINATACRDSVGLNGMWLLVNIRKDEKNTTPLTKEVLVVKDCSTLEYYIADHFVKKEIFKLYRVLNYCSDYQLNYAAKNDSICCINIRRDTLIFGDCSTFETSRFEYKKL